MQDATPALPDSPVTATSAGSLSTRKSKSKRLRPELVGLLFAAGLLTIFQASLAYNLVINYNQQPKNDLNLFLKFAKLVLNGQTPYQGDLPFIYQFWVSFVYLPFAPLEHDLALHLWVVANLGLLLVAVWLAWKAYLPELRAVWLLPLYCLALAVCSNGIVTGHTTIITLTALAASGFLMRRGRYFGAGLPAFVLLIKPQLTFLIGLAWLSLLFSYPRPADKSAPATGSLARFTANPVWRWLGGAIVGTLAILAVSLLVQPDWPVRYISTFNVAQTQGELQPDGTYLEYYKSIFPSWLDFLTGLNQPWLGLISVVVAGSLLALGGYRLWQWRAQPPVYLALAVALNLAVTPYSHVYDFPPITLALFVILARIRNDWVAGQPRPALLRAGLLALLFAIQPLSADYRWFYSQALGITLLALSFGPTPKANKPETNGPA